MLSFILFLTSQSFSVLLSFLLSFFLALPLSFCIPVSLLLSPSPLSSLLLPFTLPVHRVSVTYFRFFPLVSLPASLFLSFRLPISQSFSSYIPLSLFFFPERVLFLMLPYLPFSHLLPLSVHHFSPSPYRYHASLLMFVFFFFPTFSLSLSTPRLLPLSEAASRLTLSADIGMTLATGRQLGPCGLFRFLNKAKARAGTRRHRRHTHTSKKKKTKK